MHEQCGEINMQASDSGLLLTPDSHLDYDAGHGVGSTKQQQQEERAAMYSFFLWRMGVAGFELLP